MDELKIIKHELQLIISGEDSDGKTDFVKTVQTHLRNSKKASSEVKNPELERTEEERALIEFAIEHGILIDDKNFGTYITEGAEQKIYFNEGDTFVIKSSDAIFYTSWLDYFNSILLHNYFFSDTAYAILGFHQSDGKFLTILKQPFVESTTPTDLQIVKKFLISKGFIHKRNNDYFHPELGIIVEDLHDENVLTNNGTLFFVDTVFFITEEFYK